MEINKMCKWDSIVSQYPDMWVFIDLDRTQKRNGFIEKCFVFAICPFEEKDRYIVKFREQGRHFDCIRTTFSAPTLGVIA